MSLVGKKAPLITARAVINGNEIAENFSLENIIGEKEIVLFFCPKDFTFVCPMEILSFQELLPEFEKRNVAVIGISGDREETLLAWLSTPKKQGGIKGVGYPLIADKEKIIAANYGVFGGSWDYDDQDNLVFDGTPISFRGAFLIDKEGIVRHESINFFPLGRNIQDILRVVDAWHYTEEHDEVYPTNWEGDEAVKAT